MVLMTLVFQEKVYTRTSTSSLHPEFPSSPLLSSLETACIFLFTEGSSAWIIWLRRYWCIKLRVWFLSRPCHQSQFARALAECNISLIRSTRKLRRWTVLIREEIIKLGSPGIISPSEHYCKPHKKTNPPSAPSTAGWDKEETRNVDRRMRFHLLSLCFPSSLSAGSSHPVLHCYITSMTSETSFRSKGRAEYAQKWVKRVYKCVLRGTQKSNVEVAPERNEWIRLLLCVTLRFGAACVLSHPV